MSEQEHVFEEKDSVSGPVDENKYSSSSLEELEKKFADLNRSVGVEESASDGPSYILLRDGQLDLLINKERTIDDFLGVLEEVPDLNVDFSLGLDDGVTDAEEEYFGSFKKRVDKEREGLFGLIKRYSNFDRNLKTLLFGNKKKKASKLKGLYGEGLHLEDVINKKIESMTKLVSEASEALSYQREYLDNLKQSQENYILLKIKIDNYLSIAKTLNDDLNTALVDESLAPSEKAVVKSLLYEVNERVSSAENEKKKAMSYALLVNDLLSVASQRMNNDYNVLNAMNQVIGELKILYSGLKMLNRTRKHLVSNGAALKKLNDSYNRLRDYLLRVERNAQKQDAVNIDIISRKGSQSLYDSQSKELLKNNVASYDKANQKQMNDLEQRFNELLSSES